MTQEGLSSLEPIPRTAAQVRNGQHDDSFVRDDVRQGEGEARQQEAVDRRSVVDSGPRREGVGALGNHAEGLPHLFNEDLPQLQLAALVPVGRRIKFRTGVGV